MSDSNLHRAHHRRGDLGSSQPSHGDAGGEPRRVPTWARALAAVVLLDPSALSRTRPATRPAGPVHDGHPATAYPSAVPGRAGESAPGAGGAAAGRSVPTVLAVIDAAAALIEAGEDDSAFLLLALVDPAPDRPVTARAAMRNLAGTRRRAAAYTPPGQPGPAGPETGPFGRGVWGGPA